MRQGDISRHVVAGPCSVESREQLFEVCQRLVEIPNIQHIRVGVWKPRTRPGGFEGLGEQALIWMREVAQSGMTMADGSRIRFCCEVARAEHVEMCQHYDVGTVWIGARTVANPFMVEELCSVLQGSEMSVFVKNPICPDVRLWQGAIERLQNVGIKDIVAIHRGFSMYDNRQYRNLPLWEVALDLRRVLPKIRIYCDPSHIAGRRDMVEKVATIAMQLDYDGLFIECHPEPEKAWTDGQQQVSPEGLTTLLSHLSQHKINHAANGDIHLQSLRENIDSIDDELLSLLAQRMSISKDIAQIKRDLHLSVYQSARWDNVLADRLQKALSLGLDKDFVREMMEKIHAESIRVQLEK